MLDDDDHDYNHDFEPKLPLWTQPQPSTYSRHSSRPSLQPLLSSHPHPRRLSLPLPLNLRQKHRLRTLLFPFGPRKTLFLLTIIFSISTTFYLIHSKHIPPEPHFYGQAPGSLGEVGRPKIGDQEDIDARWKEWEEILYRRKGAKNRIAGTGESNVAIVSMMTADVGYYRMSLGNKIDYANTHSYDFYFDHRLPPPPHSPFPDPSTIIIPPDSSSTPPSTSPPHFTATRPPSLPRFLANWHKLTMINHLLPYNYSYIWWLDFDTIITNMTIRIEDVAEQQVKWRYTMEGRWEREEYVRRHNAEWGNWRDVWMDYQWEPPEGSLEGSGGEDGVVDVEEHEAPEMLIAEDCYDINAGSFLLMPGYKHPHIQHQYHQLSSPSTQFPHTIPSLNAQLRLSNFLTAVLTCGMLDNTKPEQTCIREALKPPPPPAYLAYHKSPANRAPRPTPIYTHIIVPQRFMNAYPEEITCRDDEDRVWQKGDFVMHFPGAKFYLKTFDEGRWGSGNASGDAVGWLMRKYMGEVVGND